MGLVLQQVQAAGQQVGGGKGENRLDVNRRGSQCLLTGIWIFFPPWPGRAKQGEATRPKRTEAGHTMGFFFFRSVSVVVLECPVN